MLSAWTMASAAYHPCLHFLKQTNSSWYQTNLNELLHIFFDMHTNMWVWWITSVCPAVHLSIIHSNNFNPDFTATFQTLHTNWNNDNLYHDLFTLVLVNQALFQDDRALKSWKLKFCFLSSFSKVYTVHNCYVNGWQFHIICLLLSAASWQFLAFTVQNLLLPFHSERKPTWKETLCFNTQTINKPHLLILVFLELCVCGSLKRKRRTFQIMTMMSIICSQQTK